MKRIKINTTWEEDAEERRQFYAGLTYSQRLIYFIKARKKFRPYDPTLKAFDLQVCNAKLQSGPFRELFIPDKEFDFYKNITPNSLTIKTIEAARKGIDIGKPIENISDYMKSL